MSKSKSKIPSTVLKFTPAQRQAFTDGVSRYRSVKIAGKRRPAPSAREWAA